MCKLYSQLHHLKLQYMQREPMSVPITICRLSCYYVAYENNNKWAALLAENVIIKIGRSTTGLSLSITDDKYCLSNFPYSKIP